jgi:anti-anti-sigma factor
MSLDPCIIGHPYFGCRVSEATAGSVVVRAVGELDLATCDDLHATLAPLRDKPRAILLDLSALTFIDCAGLRELQIAGLAQSRVAVVAPSAPVLRLLQLSGARVPVFESVAAALSGFTTDPRH